MCSFWIGSAVCIEYRVVHHMHLCMRVSQARAHTACVFFLHPHLLYKITSYNQQLSFMRSSCSLFVLFQFAEATVSFERRCCSTYFCWVYFWVLLHMCTMMALVEAQRCAATIQGSTKTTSRRTQQRVHYPVVEYLSSKVVVETVMSQVTHCSVVHLSLTPQPHNKMHLSNNSSILHSNNPQATSYNTYFIQFQLFGTHHCAFLFWLDESTCRSTMQWQLLLIVHSSILSLTTAMALS